MVVGRNDPCLCGSGKKYKKCCALKSEPSSEQLVDEEIERFIRSYFENAIGNQADLTELERYEREWGFQLGDLMDVKKSA